MGWLDDAWDSVSDAASDAWENVDFGDVLNQGVKSYFDSQRQQATPLVQVGPPPTGNLTPLQLAQGQMPVQQPIAAPQGGFPMPNLGSMGSMLPVILIAGVGAFFLFKRRK